MGGIGLTWSLTEAATRQYLQAPNRVVYDAVTRRLIQAGMVSNTALAAEAGTHAPAATAWVVFACGQTRYGVPLERVSEIVPPRPFTRLPGTGLEVCGLVALRGRVVTVFDIGVILGLRGAASLPDHRLLLLQLGARRVGAAVEDVIDIAPARLELQQGGNGVLGVGHTEDATFTALDPQALLNHLLPV